MAKKHIRFVRSWPIGWQGLHPFPVDLRLPNYQVRRVGPSSEVRALVDRLAGYGYTVHEISLLTGLRSSTIYRHFRAELTTSALRRDLEVIESAYLQAVGGPEGDRNFRHADASMTRFWLGQRRGWRAPTANDKVQRTALDLDRLSEDELHELERLLSRAGDADSGEGGAEA